MNKGVLKKLAIIVGAAALLCLFIYAVYVKQNAAVRWSFLAALLAFLAGWVVWQAKKIKNGAGAAGQAANIVAANPNGLSLRLVAGLLVVGALYLTIQASVGLAVMASAVLLVGLGFEEIKDPLLGFLFVQGELIGQLKPGWYLTIPGISSIERKSKAVTKAEVGHETMYTKDITEIQVEPSGYFQVTDLTKAIFISDEDAMAKVKLLMRSKAKTEVGKHEFRALISSQNTLETSIRQAIDAELVDNGYKMTTFELADFNDTVESAARRVKHVGEAEAHVAGETARKIKEGVGNSWQGVFAILGREIGKGLGNRISGPKAAGAGKKERKEEQDGQQ